LERTVVEKLVSEVSVGSLGRADLVRSRLDFGRDGLGHRDRHGESLNKVGGRREGGKW